MDWGKLANKGLGKLEEGWETGKKALGEGIDQATDWAGKGLDYVGAHDWADKVEDWGDDVASDLGASIREQQLDETEQANELIHGSPAALRESATHFKHFQAAFDRVGQGMRALDSGHWKGQAADAFREKFAMYPADWLRAADACEAAGNALLRYTETVEWAQRQAQQAIHLYKKGKKASEDAVSAYNSKVDGYNAAVRAGRDPGPKPPPFSDPGVADVKLAFETLKEARRQRNAAAATAERAIAAATEHAPAEPPPLDRAMASWVDSRGANAVEFNHFVGGVVKGTAGLLTFVRGLNPLDTYNLTHPAEYQQNVSMTLAGLVSTAAHPERVPGALIDSFSKDPSEGLGRLVPDLIGTKGFGGARAGLRVAAREGLEGVARSGIRHSDEWLTGARRRPRDILDDPAQTRWAEDAYADFMRDSRDIDAIRNHTQGLARDNGATGFSSEEITAIKKHVFDTEHPIEDYETGKVVVRKFDADAEIADAWIRLRAGNSLPEDRLLLEHELAELTYLRENPGATYQEAHRVANETYNWQNSVPLNKREDFEGEW
ncbi:WXG100 family type VII secretion target [Streptomyces sp. NPDC052042]|uniref:WXG100 family type VII secretion target n=1 Tax=Streptomyces sp. NPDC052042 TaxID=3365683 RepID=UPI0037D58ECE